MNDKLKEQLEKKIRVIPNFPKKGILFQDITSITDDQKLFKKVVTKLKEYSIKNNITKIAGIEARGFIFGSGISLYSSKPILFARKPGKLPGEIVKEKYNLEYGENTLSIQKKALKKYKSFVIVDDLLATGGTVECVAKMLRKNNKQISGLLTVVELTNLEGRKNLNFPIESLLQF